MDGARSERRPQRRAARWAVALASVMAIAASAACSGEAPTSQPIVGAGTTSSTTPAVDPPVPAGAATAFIERPGDEPRAKLRYAPHVGETRTANLTSSIDVRTRSGGDWSPVNTPTTRMTLDVTPTAIAADGLVTSTVTVTDASFDPPSTVPAEPAKALASMIGLSSESVVTPYGEVASSALDTSTVDPELKPMLDQLQTSIAQLSSPLPREPVGIGARWSVTSTTSSMGLTTTTTTTTTLLARDGPIVRTSTEVVVDVKLGPTVINGTEATIVAGDGFGVGTQELDLGSVFPTTSHVRATTLVAFEPPGPGGTSQALDEAVTSTFDAHADEGSDATGGGSTGTPTSVPETTTTTSGRGAFEDSLDAAHVRGPEVVCLLNQKDDDPAFARAVADLSQLDPTAAHVVATALLRCLSRVDIGRLLYPPGSAADDDRVCLVLQVASSDEATLAAILARDQAATQAVSDACAPTS